MRRHSVRWGAAALLTLVLLSAGSHPGFGSDSSGDSGSFLHPTYNQDVLPILAENCFACHGPDANKRKAGLSLHARDGAVARLGSGVRAIVPGDGSTSELIRRIRSSQGDEVMPPPATGKHLSSLQIQTLERWIADGAAYQPHWAYLPPVHGAVPPSPLDPWVASPVDSFILARLRRDGLQPSPDTDRITLIRRLSFDLTGLPPTTGQVDQFVSNTASDAYDRLVSQLLASPHYGERMAVWWLDLVRYADSVGYHSDNPRNVSPFRDWVIDAFNRNMPFDQFTREQIAGDLLPNATLSQRVASAYNRLIMTTEEGGAQPAEYESKSAADRVRNISSVWMGSTMQCCECHDHKFDPFSQRDFYNMEAFFADIQEAPVGPREAGEPVPDAAQSAVLEALSLHITETQAVLDGPHPELAGDQEQWEERMRHYQPPIFGMWYRIGPFPAASAKLAFDTTFIDATSVDVQAPRSDNLTWQAQTDWKDGEIHHFTGDNSATYLYRTITCQEAERIHLSLGSDDTITVWFNGHQLLAHEVYRGVAPDQENVDIACTPGANQLLIKISNGGGDYAYYFKATTTMPETLRAFLDVLPAQRSAEQATAVTGYFRSLAPQLAGTRKALMDLIAQRTALLGTLRTCLVTSSGPVRRITVKPRGNWMDVTGAECQPSVPHFLRQIDRAGRATRLDLASWLVAPDNPLVARVLVNRLWKSLFGTGLVTTLGDLGTQGARPTCQELLDYLSLDLVAHGWDIKRTIRMLVLSHAYRQSSLAGSLQSRDPDNLLLARQGRFRIEAEFVRDTALSIAGLLVDRIGGPSVNPYQPAGYWMHLNFPSREWIDSRGDDQYRRGLYTVWQRTFLHPSLLAFDASTREECCVERSVSNTPQQALVLLNDPTYLEAARTFAELVLDQQGLTDEGRVAWAMRRAVSRPPRKTEVAILLQLLVDQRALYHGHATEAELLRATGLHRPQPGLDPIDLAAWTAVTRTILNLSETITRN